MRAAFVKAPFQVQVREVPLPQVRPGWILVRVEACGICGTDLHLARTEAKDWVPFGHEIAGVAVEVGPGVTTVHEGDHVVLESGTFCRYCDACRDGRVDLCNNGPNFWGNPTMGFAEYILAPEEATVPFEGLSFEQAALVEPLGVALDLLYTAELRPGNDVLVVGLGPIGLMAIALARRMGAGRIYGAHSRPGRRLETGLIMGADEVFCVREQAVSAYPYRKRRTAGVTHREHAVDRVLVTAPPHVIPEALEVLNYGGILAFIGIEYGPRAQITFDANAFHFNKAQLRASFASPALYFPTCLQMLRDGWLKTEALISHVFPLERLGEALQLLQEDRANALKVLIRPQLTEGGGR
ncbi:MAG: alcohol dehydrogenase catalytic domain-containing protein [Anaerolineae bacterium]|nr:alcohol dehydrogenase catalytic domain-containing protein [Anaerolineae bacterium]